MYIIYSKVIWYVKTNNHDDCTNIKTSFQDGCSTIANTITEMGVTTAENASPEEIVNNIKQIASQSQASRLFYTNQNGGTVSINITNGTIFANRASQSQFDYIEKVNDTYTNPIGNISGFDVNSITLNTITLKLSNTCTIWAFGTL